MVNICVVLPPSVCTPFSVASLTPFLLIFAPSDLLNLLIFFSSSDFSKYNLFDFILLYFFVGFLNLIVIFSFFFLY